MGRTNELQQDFAPHHITRSIVQIVPVEGEQREADSGWPLMPRVIDFLRAMKLDPIAFRECYCHQGQERGLIIADGWSKLMAFDWWQTGWDAVHGGLRRYDPVNAKPRDYCIK